MATKASSQITLIDLTDGYSVILTNDNYTFLGDTDSVSGTQSTTCQIQALCGSEIVACEVDKISAPTGLSIVSDGKSPSPTLTITATSALKQSGGVIIPVKIGEITMKRIKTIATRDLCKSVKTGGCGVCPGITLSNGAWRQPRLAQRGHDRLI